MTVSFIRALFLLLSTTIGYQIGTFFINLRPDAGFIGLAAGLILSLVIIFLEMSMARISLRGLSAAVFGLVLALIVSRFILDAIDLIQMDEVLASSIKLVVVLVLSYIGMVFAMRGREEFNIIVPYVRFKGQKEKECITILDTSAIIDGRILDMVHTNFLDGSYVVPKFVVNELHALSDSADSQKRTRGRRGLDILNRLRKDENIRIRIQEQEFPNLQGVDAKLLHLAKVLDAQICTTDYNLQKIAELDEISVLNIHALSKALRPVVLPGEKMELTVSRVGKEKDQGIAYLNDGTMVVVEKGRDLVGKTVAVTVTSVLQTAAGRMIFSKAE